MNMHMLILSGRATKDAEEIVTKNDKKFAKFSIAVNEYNSTTKEEIPFYYDVLVFGKRKDTIISKVKKGDSLFLTGKPEVNAYISKKDNEAKASVVVIADKINFLK